MVKILTSAEVPLTSRRAGMHQLPATSNGVAGRVSPGRRSSDARSATARCMWT